MPRSTAERLTRLAAHADAVVATWSTMQDARPAEPLIVQDLITQVPGTQETDALTAVIRALERAGRTARIHTPVLPDNEWELAALLAVIPPAFRGEIATQLAERIGAEAAERVYDSAERELEHSEAVEQERTDLRTALTDATSAVRQAQQHLTNLHIDAEYDGTTAAGDLRSLLGSAERDLRLAALVQDHIER